MELVILCGGKGTRLSEETVSKPKPLVEIDETHPMAYYDITFVLVLRILYSFRL